MSLGQSSALSQNGQTAMGRLVSTKKPASAFSGGAMKPLISTVLPSSRLASSENSAP